VGWITLARPSLGLEGVLRTLLNVNSMMTAEEERKAREEALREDREERAALHHSEEDKLAAAHHIGINTAGTWGRKTQRSFKPRFDPPNYGSIHYWLAYAREVLLEAQRRKAFTSELRCAIEGLKGFAAQPKQSIHNVAAFRIHSELTAIHKGYSRSSS
jgi:hypothetical protein